MLSCRIRRAPEEKGNFGGTCDGWPGGYVGTLPPTPVIMVEGREDVEHDLGGEGGEVPNGLHSGDILPSLLECVRPGPQAELRPLHGYGMPPQRPP